MNNWLYNWSTLWRHWLILRMRMKPIDSRLKNSKLSTPIYLLSFSKPKKALIRQTWKIGGNSHGWEVLTNIKEWKGRGNDNRSGRIITQYQSRDMLISSQSIWPCKPHDSESPRNSRYHMRGKCRGGQGQSRKMFERVVGLSDALQNGYPFPFLSTYSPARSAHRKSELFSLDESRTQSARQKGRLPGREGLKMG